MTYSLPVTRKFHILLTTLLVATHAFAVPWHVVAEHGVNHGHAGDEAGETHVHGPTDTDADHHHEEPAPISVQAELFDASGFGSPHHHDGHAHSVTDHGFSRSRTDIAPEVPAAVLPSLTLFVHPAALLPVEAKESPPPKAPCLNAISLRGPPVS